MLYDIYDRVTESYLKRGCKFIALIPEHYELSDDEVRKWFNIDEGHWNWSHAHKPSKYRRIVFDRLIIPDLFRYEMKCAGDSYEDA